MTTTQKRLPQISSLSSTVRRGSWLPVLVGLATVVLFGFVLQWLIALGIVNGYIVPRPSEVLGSFARIIADDHVLGRFVYTAGEAFAASLVITLIGLPIGFLLFRYDTLRKATENWIAAFAGAPIVLAYPLFLVIFGRNAVTIVVIAVLAGICPVIIKTLEGFRNVRPVLINVAHAFNFTLWQKFSKVLMPAAAPTIFVGLRMGLIFSLINVVGVEFLINFGGLGPLINELSERYDMPGMYAAIGFVILISAISFFVLEFLEKCFRPK